MLRLRNDDSGFVLPAAIGALVVIGLLVTAGFMISNQELRMGVASEHANMAFDIAQAGANEVLANWTGYALGEIPTWDESVVTGTIGTIGGWEVTIRNMNNYVYFLTATGEVTNAGIWSNASRTIGIAAKMIFADIDPPGAVTTQGNVNLNGKTLVDGLDTDPTDWTSGVCDGFPDTDSPGVVTPVGATVTTTGGKASVTGDPAYGDPNHMEDNTVTDDSFTDFGNLTWSELTALANAPGGVILPASGVANFGPTAPQSSGGVCNNVPNTNWGDITEGQPCSSYFPLIYSENPNGLKLAAGSVGQGLLLVEGDLDLAGTFTFYGIIIVQGSVTTSGNDNTVYGAIMAKSGATIDQTLAGTSSVTYSRCAVQRAILNNSSLSRARPIAARSWIDLSAVVN